LNRSSPKAMKYSGRIGLLLIVLVSAAGFMIYDWIRHDEMDTASLIILGFYLILGWWLGKKHDKAKYDSARDALTNLYNRRYFLEIFPKMKALSDRRAEKLIILFIDIDNFKSINDLYNHEAGDQVLREISGHLAASFRNRGHIVRWGGDEFLVILPFTDETAMHALQAQFQNKLRTIHSHALLELSVSMGYAVYPDDGDHLNDLIKSADTSMYAQKQNKRSVLS
jgi:diguanylate cyclase (GGDEF)-like protein